LLVPCVLLAALSASTLSGSAEADAAEASSTFPS